MRRAGRESCCVSRGGAAAALRERGGCERQQGARLRDPCLMRAALPAPRALQDRSKSWIVNGEIYNYKARAARCCVCCRAAPRRALAR